MSFDEDLLARAAGVRLLLMDVDGVMTDGTYWQVPDGQGGLAEIKAFDSQDGIAFQWLRRFSVQAGVISGRVSVATEERARTAGFAYIYQGHTEKIPILEEILEKSGLPGRTGRLRRGRLHGRGRDAPRGLRGGGRECKARGEGARPLGHAEPWAATGRCATWSSCCSRPRAAGTRSCAITSSTNG